MKKKIFSILTILLVVLSIVIPVSTFKGATGSTKFSIKQNTKLITLKKGDLIELGVNYQQNTQNLYEFELNLLYESSKFEVTSDGIKSLVPDLIIIQTLPETIVQDDNCYIQFKGYSRNPITSSSGNLFTITLESTYAASNANITLMIVRTVVEDQTLHQAAYGKDLLGNSTISFTETLIPWWIWLVLAAVIVVALVGGYIFHLYAPTAVNKAYAASKKGLGAAYEKSKEGVKFAYGKTKEGITSAYNKVFNRRPVAPKMKPSSTSGTKPVQTGVKPSQTGADATKKTTVTKTTTNPTNKTEDK